MPGWRIPAGGRAGNGIGSSSPAAASSGCSSSSGAPMSGSPRLKMGLSGRNGMGRLFMSGRGAAAAGAADGAAGPADASVGMTTMRSNTEACGFGTSLGAAM